MNYSELTDFEINKLVAERLAAILMLLFLIVPVFDLALAEIIF